MDLLNVLVQLLVLVCWRAPQAGFRTASSCLYAGCAGAWEADLLERSEGGGLKAVPAAWVTVPAESRSAPKMPNVEAVAGEPWWVSLCHSC